MNTQVSERQAAPGRRSDRRAIVTAQAARPSPHVTYRAATVAEAPKLHALIHAHLEEGRLLPRSLDELRTHASRFVVATIRGRIVGCAELAPLSNRVAEVRSLVVDRRARSRGIGRRLVSELTERGRTQGFETLCAFTHEAEFFERLGFANVPHSRVPEKIAQDCIACALYQRCGQHAMVVTLPGDHGKPAKTLTSSRS
jgi:amino-acid N-acetyltransferase